MTFSPVPKKKEQIKFIYAAAIIIKQHRDTTYSIITLKNVCISSIKHQQLLDILFEAQLRNIRHLIWFLCWSSQQNIKYTYK